MKFAYPEFLWALSLLVIPILIHLFNFRKFKTIYFSNISHLKEIKEETKSRSRLKHLLILISRILAISFLVLAFAKPYLPDEETKDLKLDNIVSIYIDNSFSMTASGENGNLINMAKEYAESILNSYSNNDRFQLITNKLEGEQRRLLTKQEAIDELFQIAESPVTRNISSIFAFQNEVLFKENSESNLHYYWLSDFQKSTSDFEAIEEKGNVRILKLNAVQKSNLYIDSVWFESPVSKNKTQIDLKYRIQNSSPNSVENIQVLMECGENSREMTLGIEANASATGTFSYSDTKGVGSRTGFIKVKDAQIYYDDELFFTYDVIDHVNVLILNSELNSKNYLEKLYGLDDYYQVSSQNISNLSQDDLFKNDLVILNNVNTISSGIAKNLIEFYKSGGSVVVIPGENVDFNSINQFLLNFDLPVLENTDSSRSKLTSINSEDLLFKGVFKKIPKNINLPEVRKNYRLSSNQNSSFVSLLSFANSDPFFVRKLGGNGKIYLSSVALDASFSNFQKHSMFIGIFLRIGEMSVRSNQLFSIIGEQSQYRFITEIASNDPIHLIGQNSGIDVIPLSQNKWNEEIIFLGQGETSSNLEQGFYDVVKSNEKLGIVALNYNRKESQLEFYSQDEILSFLKQKEIQVSDFIDIQESSENFKIDLSKSEEYWRILLFLGLIFILIEILLIKFLKTN